MKDEDRKLIKMIAFLTVIALIVSFFFFGCGAKAEDFGLTNLYSKATNDRGEGNPSLYGTRNYRVVLKGVMYRSGANNTYLPVPRSNLEAMPQIGLDNLCLAGINTVVYNYSENYDKANPLTGCTNNLLQYIQISPFEMPYKLMKEVKWHIDNNKVMLTHCHNGKHAAGAASAFALMQYCSFTNKQALAYWERNTDGSNGSEYNPVRKLIMSYRPYEDLLITKQKQDEICFPAE